MTRVCLIATQNTRGHGKIDQEVCGRYPRPQGFCAAEILPIHLYVSLDTALNLFLKPVIVFAYDVGHGEHMSSDYFLT